jgi:hypothetical protein
MLIFTQQGIKFMNGGKKFFLSFVFCFFLSFIFFIYKEQIIEGKGTSV